MNKYGLRKESPDDVTHIQECEGKLDVAIQRAVHEIKPILDRWKRLGTKSVITIDLIMARLYSELLK